MRFATLYIAGQEQSCVNCGEDTWVPLDKISRDYEGDLLALIQLGLPKCSLEAIERQAEQIAAEEGVDAASARFCPPYRHPHKIWGIGLNYSEHAGDLSESAPEQPGSFIKCDHTIIGHGDNIVIPAQSSRTTAEAELGLVMKHSDMLTAVNDPLDNVFGVCAILDQTAEDILRLNPRYLTRAKNFPSFFSFGPEIITFDEFLAQKNLDDVCVSTCVDGVVIRSNTIAKMTHSPTSLVRYHNQMMPFYAGDIISTGTPGASVVSPGSYVECKIEGMATLANVVA